MKTIPLGIQAKLLTREFPDGHCDHNYRRLLWSGQAQPEIWTREYTLQLEYLIGQPPKVRVLSPDLKELSEGRKVPHLYNKERQHLCLYRPNLGLWSPEKYLARTIMPWAFSWLIYFELWLATDLWHGRAYGHPGDDPSLSMVSLN